MSKNSWEGTLEDWDQLLAAVEANQADIPQVEVFRVQLEASLTDLRALHARRATLQAETLQATDVLQATLALGRELASRIRNGVRSQYGLQSDKLVEFGLTPKRKPARERPAPGALEARGSSESHRTVK